MLEVEEVAFLVFQVVACLEIFPVLLVCLDKLQQLLALSRFEMLMPAI